MQNDITGQPPCDCFEEKRVSVIGRISRLVNIRISTTAGDVYLADFTQVPRVQAKYTADSAQVPRVHRVRKTLSVRQQC